MNLLLVSAAIACNLSFSFGNHGQISDRMCRKYSKAVYVLEPDLGMSSTSGFHNVSECGIVSVPLIIGGDAAVEKEFPHFALIGFGETPNEELSWSCGGSLISEKFVLTAAHCALNKEYGPAQKVRLGMTTLEDSSDLDDDDDVIKEEIIETFIKHPDYRGLVKYNDIALIKLKNLIEFTPYIRPACLNTKPNIQERKAIAIGFGKTTPDTDDSSKLLMKVTLDLIDRAKCNTFFPRRPAINEGVITSMICAGVLKGGKDTCQGDSGGPIQVILQDPYCMYNIIGITSFGIYCGFSNSPAIYTNVTHYLPWIENIVWNNK